MRRHVQPLPPEVPVAVAVEEDAAGSAKVAVPVIRHVGVRLRDGGATRRLRLAARGGGGGHRGGRRLTTGQRGGR